MQPVVCYTSNPECMTPTCLKMKPTFKALTALIIPNPARASTPQPAHTSLYMHTQVYIQPHPNRLLIADCLQPGKKSCCSCSTSLQPQQQHLPRNRAADRGLSAACASARQVLGWYHPSGDHCADIHPLAAQSSRRSVTVSTCPTTPQEPPCRKRKSRGINYRV